MKIITGNIWDFNKDAKIMPKPVICITTNGILDRNGHLVMGKGIALDAKKNYPDCPEYFGKMVFWYGNQPHYYAQYNLLSFPTKYHWKDKSDINLICKSASTISDMADYYKWNNIYVPGWPGCGNGGLQVSDVKRCLEVIFDDRFIIVEHKMKEKNSGNP